MRGSAGLKARSRRTRENTYSFLISLFQDETIFLYFDLVRYHHYSKSCLLDWSYRSQSIFLSLRFTPKRLFFFSLLPFYKSVNQVFGIPAPPFSDLQKRHFLIEYCINASWVHLYFLYEEPRSSFSFIDQSLSTSHRNILSIRHSRIHLHDLRMLPPRTNNNVNHTMIL